MACCSIKDNGPGMDSHTRNSALKGFFTTKGARGTGMGLMLVRKIIDQHNGLLLVESEEGAGSVFRVRLPETHSTDGSKNSLVE